MAATTWTPKAVRLALAANLALLGSDMTISAYELTSPNPPAIFIRGPSVTYDGTFGRGDDEIEFTIVVLVGYNAELTAQENLDEYLEPDGDLSIKLLIESDRQLDGACQDLRVTEATGPKLYVQDTPQGASMPPMLGCEFTVQIIV